MPGHAVRQTVHRLARLSRTAWLISWLAQTAWAGGFSPSLAWRARTRSPLQKTCTSFLMGDQVRLTLSRSHFAFLFVSAHSFLPSPVHGCHHNTLLQQNHTSFLLSASLAFSTGCFLIADSQWVAFPLLVICYKTDHLTENHLQGIINPRQLISSSHWSLNTTVQPNHMQIWPDYLTWPVVGSWKKWVLDWCYNRTVCMHALIKVLSSSSSCQQLSMTSLSEPPPLSQFLSSPCLGMLRDIHPVIEKPFLKKH